MSNAFRSAFTELQGVFVAEMGASQQVTINGTPYNCIVSELSSDEMLVHGGTGEDGGFSVMVPVSAFGVAPAKLQTIVYGTTTLSVISFKKVNDATYEIIAGDFTRKT